MTWSDATPPSRLTFLATVLTPRLGIQRALLRLAEELAHRYEVEILVLHDPGPLDVPGVTVTSLAGPTERATRRALRRRLRHTDPREVLVITGVWAGAQLLLTAPWRFRSAVAWEHSLTLHRLPTAGRRFRLRAETVARCYRLCAAVVSVSPVVAESLRKGWAVRSVVVPNLLDLPERSPGSQRHARREEPGAAGPRPVTLLTLGEARPVKNYDMLIRALPLLDLDWRLRMLGGGSQVPELQTLAESLGVADRIEWLGFVDSPAAVLGDGDVLVHPSASEALPYALFDAAEQWLPVVATDAPVMNSLVPCVVPGVLTQVDPAAIAAAITTAVSRFDSPEAAELFTTADQLRRRDYGRQAVLTGWEEVLHH